MHQLPLTILSKAEFNRLSDQGLTGNRFRRWDNLQQLEQSGYKGWVSIRSKDRDSAFFVPFVQVKHPYLYRALQLIRRRGATARDFDALYFSETPPPTTQRVMNAEIMAGGAIAGEKSPYLLYGQSQTLSLRDDLNQTGVAVEGLLASVRVRQCGEDVWMDVMEMLSQFPTSIIEFTVFSQPVGIDHRRTIFWEVRNY